MPSEKRQRQDLGRLSRLEEQQIADRRAQRARQVRGLVLLLVALVAVAFAISVFAGDDDDTDVSSDGTSTTETTEASETTEAPDTSDTTAGEQASAVADPAIGDAPCPPVDGAAERSTQFESGPDACIDTAKSYTATIATSRGDFTVELDDDRAPKAVNSFVFLARHHYYDGVAFHRIIPGFVVQGGDPNGDPPGTGGPGYSFDDELPTDGPPFYEVGSLAMANSGADTNGSQFFVVTGDEGAGLPASYTLFGRVVEGMDVVHAIEATGSAGGTPTEPTTIESVTITAS